MEHEKGTELSGSESHLIWLEIVLYLQEYDNGGDV
jgi:hypothetical protein